MHEPSRPTEPSHLPVAGRIVLLVEDEPVLRFVMAEELRDAGLRVIESSNADEALKLLATRSVDLVLTDIRMPGRMDGLTLVQYVRKDHPETKVVVMSGHFNGEAGTLSADAFLQKPFDLASAAAMLKRLLSTER